MEGNKIASALSVLSQKAAHKLHTDVVCSDEMSVVGWNKFEEVAIVQNTDPCAKPGTHWVLWYSPSRGKVEYFDSLGESPLHYNLKTPPYKIAKTNAVQFQSDDSTVCGKYCLYVFYNRQIGREYDSIMNDFSVRRKRHNDQIVTKFFNSICFTCPR